MLLVQIGLAEEYGKEQPCQASLLHSYKQSNVTVELLTEMFYLLNVILYIVDY
ncbi:hypothetical protein NR913_09515 [Ruminococcus bicirculans]|jgi:hypothetical protein|nr:hypothetical protein [Ruminococcus bicirculans (ex Wegman et al. 2014)]